MTAEEIVKLWENLELELTDSLRRNLERHKAQEAREGGQNGVPEHWEAWQAAKLREIRRFRRENEALLGKYEPKINEGTERMLEEQYAEGGSDGFFRASDHRLQALMDEMQNNEARVGQASLRYMDDVYRQTVLRTAVALNAGGMTYQKAVDEATKDFLNQGINCVEYADGRRVNIASYAEMALRTCATRAMLMGEARKREALGIDTVLVSQYGACSDTCLPWQGRVYIDDVFQDYNGSKGGSFGVSRNGKQYMLLSIAMKGGLFHPNCRHTISTWVEGISQKPGPMDAAKIEQVNKLEAVQRKMERAIRKAKRKVAGLQDPAARKEAGAEVRQLQKDLRKFVSENGDVLRRDYWRERYDGAQQDAELKNVSRTVPTSTDEVRNSVEKRQEAAIIEPNTYDRGENSVNAVTRLDLEKYKCVSDKTITDEVIITGERIQHILDRHPLDYERFRSYIPEVIRSPDYIIRDGRANTAMVLKEIVTEGGSERFRLALRLATVEDPPGYKNSILTFLKIRQKEWDRLIRNKEVLYKLE